MKIDQLTYELYIGKEPKLWAPGGGSIEKITIFHKVKYPIVMVYLTLVDHANMVGQIHDLSDGEPFNIVWGFGNTLQNYSFRISNVINEVVNNTVTYIVEGWMDEIKWFVDTTNKAYKGTSSEAISQIADESNLDFEGDVTNDRGNPWLGLARPRFAAARAWAKNGYANDESLMKISFTPGKILYKDINALNIDNPVAHFVMGSLSSETIINNRRVPTFPINSFEIKNKSGVQNLRNGGYKSRLQEQSVETSEKDGFFDRIAVRNRTNKIQRNEDIASQIETGKVITGQIRSANTNTNYNKAQYQNTRGISMLSNGIWFASHRFTNVNLLDPISVKISDVNVGSVGIFDKKSLAHDGIYIVTSRIIYLERGNYSELFEGIREGLA